ncbi:hypothetical protein GCM10009789_39210 [Kribbella sancticallisti]|uniref:Uncharacterized protein n=1 Tax=Kribbella sancticallisti TaxID=460087 RepID=A0ABP4PNM1_9ACTN
MRSDPCELIGLGRLCGCLDLGLEVWGVLGVESVVLAGLAEQDAEVARFVLWDPSGSSMAIVIASYLPSSRD